MPMEKVFGLGLGACSVAQYPFPVFRAFPRAAYDFNWAQVLKISVRQLWSLCHSAYLPMPRCVLHVPHTQNASTSSLASMKVHFAEWVLVCIDIVQPPASCNSKRRCNKRAKIVLHNRLAATMQVCNTTFRWTGAQKLAMGTFCFSDTHCW